MWIELREKQETYGLSLNSDNQRLGVIESPQECKCWVNHNHLLRQRTGQSCHQKVLQSMRCPMRRPHQRSRLRAPQRKFPAHKLQQFQPKRSWTQPSAVTAPPVDSIVVAIRQNFFCHSEKSQGENRFHQLIAGYWPWTCTLCSTYTITSTPNRRRKWEPVVLPHASHYFRNC